MRHWGIYTNPDPATLNRSAGNQANRVTGIHVQRTYPIEQAPAALADFAGSSLGKLVISTV